MTVIQIFCVCARTCSLCNQKRHKTVLWSLTSMSSAQKAFPSSSFSSSSCTNNVENNNNRKVLDNDVDNESQLSKLIEHYYHVPDFWRLPTSNHETFLISMRDVFDRSISSLLYQHPLNAQAYNLTLSNNQKTNGPMAYRLGPAN